MSSTSYVLLEVVRVPFTPCVAMTARRLSPSTRSLYFSFPLCSSIWMTALDTSGMPCTTTCTQRHEGLRRYSAHGPHQHGGCRKHSGCNKLERHVPGLLPGLSLFFSGDYQLHTKPKSAFVLFWGLGRKADVQGTCLILPSVL